MATHSCIISYLLNFFKANEVSAEAEAKGQEKNREARIAMEEKNQIGLLEVNSHAKVNAKNQEKNQEKNHAKNKANEKEKETLSVSTEASVELLLLMKTKANENLKAASMHLAESQKWETVSIQMNSDYNDYLRLADRTQERIDSGWWPEYTLLR